MDEKNLDSLIKIAEYQIEAEIQATTELGKFFIELGKYFATAGFITIIFNPERVENAILTTITALICAIVMVWMGKSIIKNRAT